MNTESLHQIKEEVAEQLSPSQLRLWDVLGIDSVARYLIGQGMGVEEVIDALLDYIEDRTE